MHKLNKTPLVTAVMITGMSTVRYSLARIAIQCFLNQTYPRRELLIVNHGRTPLNTGDPLIREMMINKSNSDTVGDLRNLALEHARGELVMSWDDDDWHHPRRMQVQVSAQRGNAAVVLKNQIRYSLLNGCAFYRHQRHGIPGTILHSRETSSRYPSLVRGSDTNFMNSFRDVKILENPPCLYVRIYHGLNLWNAKHVMRHLAKSKYQDRLELTYPDRVLLRRLGETFSDVYQRFRLPPK
jgi:glycosyltransferase involved in cell wall biosynthesis